MLQVIRYYKFTEDEGIVYDLRILTAFFKFKTFILILSFASWDREDLMCLLDFHVITNYYPREIRVDTVSLCRETGKPNLFGLVFWHFAILEYALDIKH